jgi:hypothetical protein
MTLHDFIEKYDFVDSVVLLEGKRNVKDKDQDLLVRLGYLLASQTKYILFRSGNAPGSDELFTKGVTSFCSSRIQLIKPYKNHRRKHHEGVESISLDELRIASEPEVIFHSKKDSNTNQLVERYVQGLKDSNSMKAAYIIRDAIKVLGTKTLMPASFAIFYDDLNNPRDGGTGHTMRICENKLLPHINQETWFNWL